MSKYVDLDDPDVTYYYNLGNHEVYIVGSEAERIDLVRCGECKFFELNHFDNLDGVPIITAHKICTKWGSGCKTDRNGYCFMAERIADDADK